MYGRIIVEIVSDNESPETVIRSVSLPAGLSDYIMDSISVVFGLDSEVQTWQYLHSRKHMNSLIYRRKACEDVRLANGPIFVRPYFTAFSGNCGSCSEK